MKENSTQTENDQVMRKQFLQWRPYLKICR